MKWWLKGSLPAFTSRTSSLKGLSTPLWVEITRTLPPQIKSAFTASSTARTSR